MDKFEPPSSLSFEGNLSENWTKWRQELELYLCATEKDGKADKIKTSILLTCIGKQGREVYNTFQYDTEGDNMKFDVVLEKFQDYCSPRKNITFMRHKFFTCRQKEGQSFDEFVTELKKRSADCEFSQLRDSLIRDIVICGIIDNRLRERLLREPDLSLEKTLQLGHAAEETKRHIKELQKQNETKAFVDGVKKKHSAKSKPKFTSSSSGYDKSFIKNCKFCASSHKRGNCNACGKKCRNCSKLNHFAKCCPSSSKTVKHVECNSSDSDEDYAADNTFFVGSVTADTSVEKSDTEEIVSNITITNTMGSTDSCSEEYDPEFKIFSLDSELKEKSEWTVEMQTNGSSVSFKLDTGAQVNVLPKSQYDRLLRKPKLKNTKVKLTAYNGTSIPVVGRCIVRISHKKNRDIPVMFIVADTSSPPILGLSTCENLNLIKRVMTVKSKEEQLPDFISDFDSCFGELGTLPKVHKIVIDPSVPPVVHPPRRVPIALQPKLKEELDRMEKLGVISKVTEPTDWVSNLVVVEKENGKLRVCLDPKDLNQAIKRPHLQLPTAEDIISKMTGARYFSKLDASSGFWQIQLDEESSKLLCFNSPFGRFKFNRLPFGVSSASEIFQLDIAEIIEGVEGAANAQDDIVIWGETKEIHDQRLREILSGIKDSGLKLNRSKCKFCVTQITFLGHVLSSEGVYADPRKVSAIIDMPTPGNKTELQRFLGMCNYLGKFMPNLADVTAPLRCLLEKDTPWHFELEQENAFKKLKEMVTSTPVLKYFDPKHQIKVTSDSSKLGLGAVLEQKEEGHWKPVAFASRSLTPAEQNYAQIEKETLSVLFACEKFKEYLYGQMFVVENDHQPLKAIFSKPLYKTPARIQRFLLRLQPYMFTFKFVPGKDIPIADTLSRAFLNDSNPEIPESDLSYFVHAINDHRSISKSKLSEFAAETAKDPALQKLKDYVMNGWPNNKNQVDLAVRPYFNFRDEVTVYEDVLLKCDRIIVPSSLRSEMRQKIHHGHLGIEKCKARARSTLYWPGMISEIVNIVSNCNVCLENRNYQSPEELIPHEIPSTPWEKVGTDLFSLKNKDYVIVVDYTSKYFEVSALANKLSSTVVQHTKSIFARHGVPKFVFSDNGPEFIAQEYKSFAKEWGFYHDSSSPKYPRSNGFVERTIQTVKNTMRKAIDNGDDPCLALLALRTTPGTDNSPSPAFRLMNRHLRTPLPYLKTEKESPPLPRSSKVKEHHDKHSKMLEPLKDGQTIRVREGKSWSVKGQVKEKAKQPRSYIVKTEKGSTIRRNRRDILKTAEQFEPNSLPEYEIELPTTQPQSAQPQSTQVVSNSPSTSAEQPSFSLNQPPAQTSASGEQCYKTRSGRTVKPPSHLKDYVHR